MIWGISARDLCQSIWDKIIMRLGNDGFTLSVTYSMTSFTSINREYMTRAFIYYSFFNQI